MRRYALPGDRPDRLVPDHPREQHRLGHATHRALTGAGADAEIRERLDELDRAAGLLKTRIASAISTGIANLQDELRAAKQRAKAAGGSGLPRPGDLVGRAETIDGHRAILAAIEAASLDELKGLARDTRGAMGGGVIALILDADEPHVFVTVSDDLVAMGVSAGDLVRAAMAALGGKGGGRPEMAQGKGTDRAGVQRALDAIRSALATEG